jgi:hypothetical protein
MMLVGLPLPVSRWILNIGVEVIPGSAKHVTELIVIEPTTLK